MVSANRSQTVLTANTHMPSYLFRFGLISITITLFWQIWFDLAGFTLRSEDIIAFFLVGGFLLSALLTGKFRYKHHILNLPLVLYLVAIIVSIGVTLVSNYDVVIQQHALVNGIRMLLAFSLFFVVYNHSMLASEKLSLFVKTVVGFSFITTAVSLLQIAYWDKWFNLTLPPILITFQEGANTDSGREIFALFLGDTGSHTWAGALVFQALLVWLLARHNRNQLLKAGLFTYFILLITILVRISVRNSILGLFITLIGVELLHYTRQISLRFLRFLLIFVGACIAIFSLIYFAPESYFVERVLQAVPTIQNGQLAISRQSNVYGRFEYWALAFNLFLSYPLLGSGFYTYQAFSPFYSFGHLITHAHNSYFHTAAELGLMGVFSLTILIASLSYYLFTIRRHVRHQPKLHFWWEFLVASFLFFAFTAIFSNTFWVPNYIYMRMIALGILASLISEQQFYTPQQL